MRLGLNNMKQFLIVMLFAAALIGCGKKDEASAKSEAGDNTPTVKVGTDLLGASISGNLESVHEHIATGADLDQRTQDGQNSTPLILAIIFGHDVVATVLIDAGADVNLQQADGSTALIVAASMGHSAIVKALLNYGADPNIKNKTGRTALGVLSVTWEDAKGMYDFIGTAWAPYGLKMDYERIKKARPICAQILEAHVEPINTRTAAHPPITDIFGAVLYEDLAATKKFIGEGVDVNASEPEKGDTPLHKATLVCNIEIVKALITSGANVNAKNKKGETPLRVVAASWKGMPLLYGLVSGFTRKKFDLDRIKQDRGKVAEILRAAGAK